MKSKALITLVHEVLPFGTLIAEVLIPRTIVHLRLLHTISSISLVYETRFVDSEVLEVASTFMDARRESRMHTSRTQRSEQSV